VNILENRDNVGFALANNQAIPFCKGSYILLLNPDTLVHPRALDRLVEFMETHLHAGAAGPRLVNPDNSLQVSCFPFPTLVRELWRLLHLDALRPLGIYSMHTWSLEAPREVNSLQGACLLIRREVLNRVGLLDPTYFMYTEEIDLCYRICQAGWKLYWVPSAQVVHYGGGSTRQVAQTMFLHLYESKLRFFRKHHGRLAAWLYKSILFAAAVFRLSLTPFTFLERRSVRRNHLELARSYLQLVAALPGW